MKAAESMSNKAELTAYTEERKSARIQMAAAMAIFSTLGMFVKNIQLSSGALALCRAMLAAGLIAVYMLVRGMRISFSAIRREIFFLLVSGVAMGINWILLFEAYNYTTVSNATLSYYFAPVLVTAVCPILFREKLNLRQALCFCMSTIGVVLIIGVSGFSGSGSDVTGIFLGLGAAVFYASVTLLNKFIKNVTGIHRTFLQLTAAIVILIPYVICTGGLGLDRLDGAGWANLMVVGLIHTGITYCMYFSAIKDMKGQQAAILSYIDPLVAVIVSVAVLGESISALQMLGGAMILGFAILNEITPKSER